MKVPDAPAGEDVALTELVTANWFQLLTVLGLTGIVQNIAANCELKANVGGVLEFVLDSEHATLFNDGHQDKLRLALENYYAQSLSVSITPGQVNSETPAMRATRLAHERQREAVDSIENDPNLQALIGRFDAELDRSSIAPIDS